MRSHWVSRVRRMDIVYIVMTMQSSMNAVHVQGDARRPH